MRENMHVFVFLSLAYIIIASYIQCVENVISFFLTSAQNSIVYLNHVFYIHLFGDGYLVQLHSLVAVPYNKHGNASIFGECCLRFL